MVHLRFIFRQIAGSRKQAIIFLLCVALSLLILTSLGGLSRNVRSLMDQDARSLHGADITLHSHYPFSASVLGTIDGYEKNGLVQGALVNKFYSMARNPLTEKSILSDLKVVERGYPFYGTVELRSGREFSQVLQEGSIIVGQVLLDRLQAKVGDTLQIGSARLRIADVVIMEPDRPVSFFSFGPRIFIAASDLEKLDLIKKGSRIRFEYFLKVYDPAIVDQLARELSTQTVPSQESVRTFRDGNARINHFFGNLLFFLNLIGLFTLVLAGIGIQTSLYAVFRESEYTIAVMKAVGATGRFISLHFTLMVLLLGSAGIVLGLVLSSFLQFYFPLLFADILPARLNLVISWSTVFEGIILGTIVVGLFSFLPLHGIRHLKPAAIFRKEFDRVPRGGVLYGGIFIITLFFIGLVIWQLEDITIGLYFILGLCGLIGLAALVTQGLLFVMKKQAPGSLALRQAFRGLFRPNNATLAIIVTLSVSLAVIFSIYPTIQERGHARKLRVRISGRLLNVRSGRRLNNFEVESPSASNLPSDCDRGCELERVGSEARYLARDLGAVLARKLDWLVSARGDRIEDRRPDDADFRSGLTTAYVLTFSGFARRDLNNIEDIITDFRGYEHLRTISSSLRTQEYWYETSSGSARLNRNLRLMLEDLGIRARLVYAGNEFTLEKY